MATVRLSQYVKRVCSVASCRVALVIMLVYVTLSVCCPFLAAVVILAASGGEQAIFTETQVSQFAYSLAIGVGPVAEAPYALGIVKLQHKANKAAFNDG